MLSDQDKKELQEKIQTNTHEIYVISFEEMDAIIRSSPKGSKQSVQALWQEVQGKMRLGATYSASAADAVIATRLITDLGGINAKAYVKNYGGKPHIIIKGHPGLRTILTGTKYGIKNPKVVSMGLGTTAATSAAKSGGILTVVLLSGYRVADYFLTDQTTLYQLIGALAMDIVKVGLVVGASIGFAVGFGASTIAAGPIIAVVLMGTGLGMLLDHIDNRLGITNRVIAGLEELGENTEHYVAERKKQVINAAGRAVNQVIDYAVESAQRVAINWIRDATRDYLGPYRSL